MWRLPLRWFTRKDTPPPTKEILKVGGRTQLNFDEVGPERRPSAISMNDLEDMEADPQIAASLAVVAMPVTAADWRISCEDENEKDIPKFVEKALRRIWFPFVSEAMGSGLPYGFSPQEKRWELDSDDHWVYKVPLAVHPRNVKLLRRRNDFAGFVQTDIQGAEPVRAEKCFVFVHNKRHGNMYGRPRTFGAYKPYWVGKHMMRFTASYYEQSANPQKEGRAPAVATVVGADGGKRQIDGMAKLYDEVLAKLGADKSYYCLDSSRDEEGNFLWDVIYKELNPAHGRNHILFLQYLDLLKTRGILVPDLTMFQHTQIGSRAMAETHGDVFWQLERGLLDSFKWSVDLYMIPQLVRYNFGAKAPACHWEYEPLAPETVEWLKRLVDRMVQSGSVLPHLDEISDRLGLGLDKQETPKPTPFQERQDAEDDDDDSNDASGRSPQLSRHSSSADIRALIHSKCLARETLIW